MFAAFAVVVGLVGIAAAPSGRKRVGVRGGVAAFDARSSPAGSGGGGAAPPPFAPPTTPARRGDAAGKISFAVVAAAVVSPPPPSPPLAPGARDPATVVNTADAHGDDATAAPAGVSDATVAVGSPCTLWLFTPSAATVMSPT